MNAQFATNQAAGGITVILKWRDCLFSSEYFISYLLKNGASDLLLHENNLL